MYRIDRPPPSSWKKHKNIVYRLFDFTYNKVGNVFEEKSVYRRSPDRHKDIVLPIQNPWIGFFHVQNDKTLGSFAELSGTRLGGLTKMGTDGWDGADFRNGFIGTFRRFEFISAEHPRGQPKDDHIL